MVSVRIVSEKCPNRPIWASELSELSLDIRTSDAVRTQNGGSLSGGCGCGVIYTPDFSMWMPFETPVGYYS